MNRIINRIIFLLSILGLFVSAFLAYEYFKGGSIVCPITGTGCDIVRKSAYSQLFGIGLPYFGALFYLAVAFLSIIHTHSYIKKINLLRFLVITLGFAFGIYLTFLEAFVIKAYCIWCITSFLISTVIFLIGFYQIKKNEN